VDNWMFVVNFVMNLFTWAIILVVGFLLRNYLPTYFQERVWTTNDTKGGERRERVSAFRGLSLVSRSKAPIPQMDAMMH